jgi:hypothetical protein
MKMKIIQKQKKIKNIITMIKIILRDLDITKKILIAIMAIIIIIHMVVQKNIGKKKEEKSITQKKLSLNILTKINNIIKIQPIKILLMTL